MIPGRDMIFKWLTSSNQSSQGIIISLLHNTHKEISSNINEHIRYFKNYFFARKVFLEDKDKIMTFRKMLYTFHLIKLFNNANFNIQ